MIQDVARHSDVRATVRTYADLRVLDLHGAVVTLAAEAWTRSEDAWVGACS